MAPFELLCRLRFGKRGVRHRKTLDSWAKGCESFRRVMLLGDCASLASQSQNPDSKFPSSVELFAMDDAAAGLVGGKHQHLGYLYMLGSLYGIEHHIGHIISGKRLDALINLVGTVLVAVKTHP